MNSKNLEENDKLSLNTLTIGNQLASDIPEQKVSLKPNDFPQYFSTDEKNTNNNLRGLNISSNYYINPYDKALSDKGPDSHIHEYKASKQLQLEKNKKSSDNNSDNSKKFNYQNNVN